MPGELKWEKRWVRWAAGFCFWTLIALLYASNRQIRGAPVDWETALQGALPRWYVWGLLAALIVAVDKRLPVAREAIFRRALYHVPLSVVFTLAYLYLFDTVVAWQQGAVGPGLIASLVDSFGGMLQWNVPIYWGIVGAYGAYDYYRSDQQRRMKAVELERLLAESRLDALRAQLHPHFLFNALNAISAHVERDPRTARRMLEQLGELLRLSLEHSRNQEIPLEEELAFLESYLAIQRVRFEDRLDVTVDVPDEVLHGMVPTFVLQPLVENAIRHGIAARSSRGSLEIKAWRDNGALRLRVADDGPGLSEAPTEGVGLSNTRERLKRLYGEQGQSLALQSSPGAGVTVDVTLPFHEAHGNGSNGHR